MSESASPAGDEPFRVGDWRVDPSAGRISQGSEETRLEPKVMAVLVCLAQSAGRVVSREQLEDEVWADVVVGYDSLASTVIKLRKAFGDDSRHPRIVETVPKKGYRLIAPVDCGPASETAPAPPLAGAPVDATTETPAPDRGSSVWLALGLFASIALLSAVLWLLQEGSGPSTPAEPGGVAANDGHLSIAVLPFRNISDDAAQSYFSDGVTADLITDLSRISGLAVIARNSSFAYRDSDIDVRQLGARLGARYILEGSIRKAGDRVRISARLIDTNSGFNLWADRFDSQLSDVFAIQDEVTAKIVSSLKIHLTEQDRSRLAHHYTDSIEAYDSFLRGWGYFWEFSEEGNALARQSYKTAIEQDPGFARAYANLAIAYAYEYMNGWSDDPPGSLASARQYAEQGVALDPGLPQVHWALGLVNMFDRDYISALANAERTLELNPGHADGYGLLATILNYAGRPQEALEVMQQAMRLNPRHPFAYRVNRGVIYFSLGDYANAVQDLREALQRNPEAYEARLWLAAAYGHLGERDEASWQIEHIRNNGGEVSLDSVEQTIPLNDPVHRSNLLDGLIKAGVQ